MVYLSLNIQEILKYLVETIGNISGSVTSTGSLGSLIVDGASIDFSNLPTSDPGIAGRVFRQGTDLKISTGGV